MKIRPEHPSQERLRQLFVYNPAIGHFVWRVARTGGVKPGYVAGSLNRSIGYWRTCVDGVRYLEHRLIWIYHHGALGDAELDHINQIKTDNRIENLRIADRSMQLQNCDAVFGMSKFRGVHWHARLGKWQSSIMLLRHSYHLGYFDSEESAAMAYVRAKELFHAAHLAPENLRAAIGKLPS